MPTVCQALTGCWEYGKRGQDTITCGTGTLVGVGLEFASHSVNAPSVPCVT